MTKQELEDKVKELEKKNSELAEENKALAEELDKAVQFAEGKAAAAANSKDFVFAFEGKSYKLLSKKFRHPSLGEVTAQKIEQEVKDNRPHITKALVDEYNAGQRRAVIELIDTINKKGDK